MKIMKILGLSIAAALLASSASSATFTYELEVENEGKELSSTFSFNDVTDEFGLTFDVDTSSIDGAWWVVNDGPNPASTGANTLAILYTDLTNVWAYEYTGDYERNDPNASGTLLEYYADVATSAPSSTSGLTTISVDIDVTDLNAATNTSDPSAWEGLQFDQTIGTWLHPTIGAFANCGALVNDETALNCFDGSNWIGWDRSNQTTTLQAVPVPGALGLAVGPLALMGFGAWRRRKAAA